MASSQRGMGESRVSSLLFKSLKSMQKRVSPDFFLTSTTRLPHGELDLRMMPLASISAT